MVRVEIDARVGGTFCFVDRRDGEDVEHTGTYLEIERPRRLVLTLAVHKASFTADFTEPTRIVIEIVPLGSGCELTLTHEDVLTDYADKTESGWGVVLDKLAAAVSRKEE